MHAIAKKITNCSITSKWKKCFDNWNLKLHVNPFTQESWFQTLITNYVSTWNLFIGFIDITVWNSTDTGRQNHLLFFYKLAALEVMWHWFQFMTPANNKIRTWIIHFGLFYFIPSVVRNKWESPSVVLHRTNLNQTAMPWFSAYFDRHLIYNRLCQTDLIGLLEQKENSENRFGWCCFSTFAEWVSSAPCWRIRSFRVFVQKWLFEEALFL